MKILELDVSGFRSLKNVTWKPGDLNVIIGPNGSGKSNLLRVLEMISVSAQGQLGKYIQTSGGMEPLVWDGRTDHISFRLKMSPPEQMRPPAEQTYSVTLARIGAGSSYRVEYELLADFDKFDRKLKSQPFKHLERQNLSAKIFDEAEHSLIAPEESVKEEETFLSQIAFPFVTNRWLPAFNKELSAWSIYQDLHVNREATIRQSAVTKVEKRVLPNGQNLISVLHTLYTGDRNFKQSINEAMTAAFGSDFDELVFPPAADQRTQLRVRWKTLRREQSAADLSDGTLRFLFLLTVLASPSPAPLIAIDEPETGLHPSMLPIIAEYAVDAARHSQIIITTHSDQFLDAFGRTVPTTTIAKWEEGETRLTTLNGEALDYWLKEYSLGALYRSRELENMA